MPFQAHVSVAKAGIDSLSNSVAVEYGPRGVTSNIIAPGPIKSTEVGLLTHEIYLVSAESNDLFRAWIAFFRQMSRRHISNLSL